MSSRNRITHLIVRLDTGGAEKSLYRLIQGTRDKLSHHVICFGTATPIGADIEALGVKVSWLDYSRFGPLVIWQALRLLREEPPAVLQGWMYFGNVLASIIVLALPRQTKVAWNIRSSQENFSTEKWRTRAVVKLARLFHPDLVIYNSYAGLLTHESLGFNRFCHTVIPNGLDLQMYQPSETVRQNFREKYSMGEQRWIGLVTRYHPAKGVKEFLQAVKILRDQGLTARVSLIGSGMQVENLELTELMRELGLSIEDVELLGLWPETATWLPALDIVVIASLREGTPNILLEAMACGVNTVATMVGDVPRILQDAARRVPPADVEALAAAISLACADVDRDERIVREREYLAEHYALEHCMAAYLKTYEALIH